MKLLVAAFFLSFSAYADFSGAHEELCKSKEVRKTMGSKGSCQLLLSPVTVPEFSAKCEGKLADLNCRILVLKTSDSSTVNLHCGEVDSPILTQIVEAEVLSYDVSALVKNSSGDYSTISDLKRHFIVSSSALDIQLSLGESLRGIIRMTLQEKSIALSSVNCE